MLPKNRAPTSPGEILKEEFLKPLKITQAQLAAKTGISVQTINLLINDKRSITAETALKFALAFDTSPEFWMNLQNGVDLWNARREMAQQA